MNLTVDIQIATEDDDHPPPSVIEQWITAAIRPHKDEAELTLRIVGETEITELNRNYRGKDQPTNVLSFPADLPNHIDLPLLGDVVICAPVVASQAHEQNKPSQAHWAHMVVHGTLHLLGYDHIDDNDAETMEKLEIDILASLNIANPYVTNTSHDNSTVNL